VRLWDAATGAAVKQFNGHVGAVFAVAGSQNGERAVSGGADGSVRLWDVASGNALRQWNLGDPATAVYAVALGHDGAWLAAGGAGRQVRIWDANSGGDVKTLTGLSEAVYGVAFNPQGTRLAACDHAGHVLVWDIAGGNVIHQARVPSVAFALSYSADGTQLLIAGGSGATYAMAVPDGAR
jgi:WD40 repeat protein